MSMHAGTTQGGETVGGSSGSGDLARASGLLQGPVRSPLVSIHMCEFQPARTQS
jgi:hypothetical protein